MLRGSLKGLVWSVAGVTVLMLGASAHADTLDYSDTANNSQTSRAAGDAPLASVSSGTNVTITRFEISDKLSANGNLNFVIFNEDTSTLLYQSRAIAFAGDSAATIKSSPVISFAMQAGVTYGFGALADVAMSQGYDFPITAYSQNGIAASVNGNATNFNSPTFAGLAAAEIALNSSSEWGLGWHEPFRNDGFDATSPAGRDVMHHGGCK